MNLRATGKRVLIEPLPPPEMLTGRFYAPLAYQTPSNEGTVLSVGEQVADVKAGDRVIYSWIDGTEVKFDGKLFCLMHEGNLKAKRCNEGTHEHENECVLQGQGNAGENAGPDCETGHGV